MTTQTGLLRRVPAVAGLTAVLAMGAFTVSCSKEEEKAPETSTTITTTTTTTATTTPAPATPTEKAPRIDPGKPNPFSPTIYAPPAPGATPGRHRGGNAE
ncbi:hypothetical protein [Mycobacterium sp. E740]|uniref:hypothetical protein n=1 Tax=Mycobacterium sp. E740 TaxID=1834149 RepID=UPI0007FE2402|nr:hypothetical protein [Mycobacterium sp. E740]OBI84034.1 hypothetical protein A5663_01160 [Mycobacterium sp. E740]